MLSFKMVFEVLNDYYCECSWKKMVIDMQKHFEVQLVL